MREARKVVSVAIEPSEEQKKMSVWQHQTKVHVASLMDICHLENTDDPGAHAVFTAQGSFASQMAAATVMDIIEGLSDWQPTY